MNPGPKRNLRSATTCFSLCSSYSAVLEGPHGDGTSPINRFVNLRTEDSTKPARNFTASAMHVLPHCRSLRCHQLGCESVIIAISGCHNGLRSVVTNPCMHLTFISLRRSQVTPFNESIVISWCSMSTTLPPAAGAPRLP